jgi:EAL domain-containing protein (putative c-di-GMP-specific phosphodiesterase class I)
VRNDVAIVSGILSLARALERTVIAEGIESAAQREWLLRAGCRFGQGYLFGRPMSAADIRRQCSANPFVIGDEDDALAG